MAKAQAAEQKAQTARDDTARALAWREAARQWDRAAERENSDKARAEYAAHAEAARAKADGGEDDAGEGGDAAMRSDDEDAASSEVERDGDAPPERWLN